MDETEKGHLNQRRQGIFSNTSNQPHKSNQMELQHQEPYNDQTYSVFMAMKEVVGEFFSDQTGQYSITSNKVNTYVLVFYIVNGNTIK